MWHASHCTNEASSLVGCEFSFSQYSSWIWWLTFGACFSELDRFPTTTTTTTKLSCQADSCRLSTVAQVDTLMYVNNPFFSHPHFILTPILCETILKYRMLSTEAHWWCLLLLFFYENLERERERVCWWSRMRSVSCSLLLSVFHLPNIVLLFCDLLLIKAVYCEPNKVRSSV